MCKLANAKVPVILLLKKNYNFSESRFLPLGNNCSQISDLVTKGSRVCPAARHFLQMRK